MVKSSQPMKVAPMDCAHVSFDSAGNFTARYLHFPEFPMLYHQGGGKPTQVALTFDDGPDPNWTPRILDILKAAKIKAAFFLVGVNAERYPESR